MAHIEIEGLDEWMEQLETLSDEIEKINSSALYEGARVMADAVDASIDQIPQESFFQGNAKMAEKERKELHEKMVISHHIKKNGDVECYIDWAGYNFFRLGGEEINSTSRLRDFYGEGTPIRLIARSICRGVSKGSIHRKKDDFVKRAYKNSKEKAEKVMKDKVDNSINLILKNK